MATLEQSSLRLTPSNQNGEPASSGTGTPAVSVVAETAAGQASAVGVSTNYARQDHTHGTPALPTPAAIGAAATVHAHAQADVTGLVSALAGLQPLDTELTAIAGLVSAADRLPYFTGSGTAALAPFTVAGRAIVDDADNVAQRATLGLGTMATQAASAVAITGGTITGVALQDKGGHVFNVKAYGAVGDGTADDTAAISATITAAAAISPRGVVFFPPGIYKTTGGHALDGLSGLSIVGSGAGSTVIRLAHATNDLFSVAATITVNLTIKDFSVTSDTVTRTAGWVFHVNNAYNGTGMLRRSYFGGLEFRKQFNGMAIKKYEFVMAEKILMWDPASSTTGVGLQAGQTTSTNINQGSELHLSDIQIYGNDLAGSSPYLGAAFRIEDCDAVYMARCGGAGLYGKVLDLVANSGGHTPVNHFFMLCAFDATKTGASCHVGGTGSFENLQWNGCWFASAGKVSGGTLSAPAFLIDCTGVVSMSKVTGSTFYASAGNGLRVASSNHVTLLVEGNTFSSCGTGAVAGNRAGIYVSVPSGYLAPSIVGNYEANSGLYSVESASTATKLHVAGNKFITGTSYGVVPEGIASGTYTPTLTNLANVASTSGVVAYYARVGDVVHVSGSFLLTPTAANTQTRLAISLPIASNLTSLYDCSGQMNRDVGSIIPGRVIADTTGDRAEMQVYVNADIFGRDHYFSFTYVVK